jgi:hypothetical protein
VLEYHGGVVVVGGRPYLAGIKEDLDLPATGDVSAGDGAPIGGVTQATVGLVLLIEGGEAVVVAGGLPRVHAAGDEYGKK